jgi:hypothetical protein
MSLLRRSLRLETRNNGFNPSFSIKETAADASVTPRKVKNKGKGKAPLADEGSAYEGHTIPGALSSPHLSLSNAQVIGVGFCKMPPGLMRCCSVVPMLARRPKMWRGFDL